MTITLSGCSTVGAGSDKQIVFDRRNAANATSLFIQLMDGGVGYMAGLAYQKDVGATISATSDLGVSGLVPHGMVHFEHFGAVGDNATDVTTLLQKAVDYSVASGQMLWIKKTGSAVQSLYVTSNAIQINGPINIGGDGRGYCGIVCGESNGFEIAAGVNFVNLQDFCILKRVRYAVSANEFAGVKTLGGDTSRNFWHLYSGLFLDGWKWAFDVSYFWASVIENCVSVFAYGGLIARGLSVNNNVNNNELGGGKYAGSVGVQIGSGERATEGWFVTDNLIEGFAISVRGLCAGNCHVKGNILDFFQQYGVFMEGNAIGGSINWTVAANYMATDSASASSGVRMLNNFSASSPQNRGHRIAENQILAYDGAGLAYGIVQDGTAEKVNTITGNSVDATTFACKIFEGEGTIVANNHWKGGAFETDVAVNYNNNEGQITHNAAFPNPSGIFTPEVFGSSAAGAGTYTVQKGTYDIIDGVVHFMLKVSWTAHTGTGGLRVKGLPFNVRNDGDYFPPCNIYVEGIDFPAGCTLLQAFCRKGEDVVELRGAGNGVGPTAVAMDSAGSVSLSGSYRI